jgi:hypothetical protein
MLKQSLDEILMPLINAYNSLGYALLIYIFLLFSFHKIFLKLILNNLNAIRYSLTVFYVKVFYFEVDEENLSEAK